MKKFKLLALAIMFLSFSLIFTGCSFGKSKDKSYAVYFVADESSTEFVKVIETSGNTEIDLPVVEKEGYVFDGWYYSSKQSTELFTSTSLVSTSLDRDIVVFAKWKPEVYNISLEVVSNGVFNNQSCGTATINGSSKVDNAKVGDSFDLKANAIGSYKFFGWYLSEYVVTNVNQLNTSLLISTDPNYRLTLNNSNFGKQYLYAKFGTGVTININYGETNTSVEIQGDNLDSIKLIDEIKNTLGITSNIRRDEENQNVYLVYIMNFDVNGYATSRAYFDDELISYSNQTTTLVSSPSFKEDYDFLNSNIQYIKDISLHYIKKYFTLTFKYATLLDQPRLSISYINYLSSITDENIARNYKAPSKKDRYTYVSIDFKFTMSRGVYVPYSNAMGYLEIPSDLEFVRLQNELTPEIIFTQQQDPYTRGYWSNKTFTIITRQK